MSLLQPDRYFARITCIDVQRDLLACGIFHALLDIDNTILTRDTHEVPRDVRRWLQQAQDSGVSLCLVSNNWHADVYDVAQELGLCIVAKSCKPLPHGLVKGCVKIGGSRRSTAVIGDQLYTDVVGANLLGMRSYLVAPLVEQDLKHTLVLRRFERAMLGERRPEGVSHAEIVCLGASHSSFEVTRYAQRRLPGLGA